MLIQAVDRGLHCMACHAPIPIVQVSWLEGDDVKAYEIYLCRECILMPRYIPLPPLKDRSHLYRDVWGVF